MADLTVSADMSEMRRHVKGLERLSAKGFFYAAKDALRGTVAEAQHEWKQEMGERLTLRNRWTQGSIRGTAPRGTNLGNTEAVVGSLADYLRESEEGATVDSRGQFGEPIPLTRARTGANPKRLVARRNKMSNIKLRNRRGVGKSNKQRVAIAARRAYAEGEKFVLVSTESGKANIYSLRGAKRRPKMKRVWNLERQSFRIEAHPTMRAAMLRAQANYPRRYAVALRAQVHRALKS